MTDHAKLVEQYMTKLSSKKKGLSKIAEAGYIEGFVGKLLQEADSLDKSAGIMDALRQGKDIHIPPALVGAGVGAAGLAGLGGLGYGGYKLQQYLKNRKQEQEAPALAEEDMGDLSYLADYDPYSMSGLFPSQYDLLTGY